MLKDLAKISKKLTDTEQIAHSLLGAILRLNKPKALVVGLSGDLGVGKTTFTQFIAKKLGRKTNSPTFVIMKKYPIKHGSYRFLIHIDAYRLKNERELLSLGWEEIIQNKENLIFIEWPENVKKIIPKDAIFVNIFHTKDGHRSFKIRKSKMI